MEHEIISPQSVVFDTSVPNEKFEPSLLKIRDHGTTTPLTTLCVVADSCSQVDNFADVWGLNTQYWGKYSIFVEYEKWGELEVDMYPPVVLHHAETGHAYWVMCKGVPYLPSKAATLCLATSDVVIVVINFWRAKPDALFVNHTCISLFNVLKIMATLEPELQPSTKIIASLEGSISTEDTCSMIQGVISQVEGLATWTHCHLSKGPQGWCTNDVELMRGLIKPSTHRFIETNWAAFVLSTWKVLTEGRMPTPDTAVTGILDWVRDREENMVAQLQKAPIQNLYNCSMLEETQAVLTKELEVLTRWIKADQAELCERVKQRLVYATFDAAQARLSAQFKVSFQKEVNNVRASVKNSVTSWDNMRSRLEIARNARVAEFKKAISELRLVVYTRGRRLLGLGLTPDTFELTSLGSVKRDTDQMTLLQLNESCAQFSKALSQVVESELSANFDLLCQHIQTDRLTSLVTSFENLCTSRDISSLGPKMWDLCVSTTRSLWKTHGPGFRNLLYTPDQLQKCSAAIEDVLIGDTRDKPVNQLRHPWDCLLMQVMSHLVSQLDSKTKAVSRLLNLRDKEMKSKGMSQSEALHEDIALKNALCNLNLINTRPHSLAVELLPLLELQPQEEELLRLSLDSLNDAWEQFKQESESSMPPETIIPEITTSETTAPDTHISRTSSSPTTPSVTDFTWHWASE